MNALTKLLIPMAALAFVVSAACGARAANCAAYTYTLTNGTTADANKVMSNFNTVRDCANNNLAHNGANSDITSLTGLSTPLGTAYGGTGNTTGQPSGAAGGSLAGSYPNPTLAAQADQTILGNVSGGSAAPTALTATQVETMIQGKLPFEYNVFQGGTAGNAWIMGSYTPSTGLVLTTAASKCNVGTAATGTTTYTLKDNGSSIGTAVITAGTTTCTATITSSPYTVTAGHNLTLVGPATGDATAADVGFTFGGTRN